MNQREEDIRDLQCIHAKAAMRFFPRWEDYYTIADIEDTDQSYTVFCNQDIKVQTFSQEGRFLAAIQTDGEVTLLFTVGKKQKFPLCSRAGCSRKVKCLCYKKYKAVIRGEEGSEDDEDNRYYWNRRAGPRSTLVEHFLDGQDQNYSKKHGYNRTKFEYPIKRNIELQEKFKRRINGIFDLPDSIAPQYDDTEVCEKHGNTFNPDDHKLILLSENIIIYTESIDKIFPVKVYGRPTMTGCKCILQADTHDLLLWNMGSGHLLDYLFLHNQVHKTVTSGSAMNATFDARKTALSSVGLSSSLSYSVFRRACTGYTQMIQFKKEDFVCSSCGDSPSYLVCDGKTDGPSKRQVSHIDELDRYEEDENVLCQGSFFQDRVFLSENRERKMICSLLTKNVSIEDFIQSDDISSANGILVKDLVERVSVSWPDDDLPKPYHRFIANISKYTSVAGYLQVTGPEALDILTRFCQDNLDLRCVENKEMQKKVASELPALWPNIVDILKLERTNYLPADVSIIILKLLKIRKDTFLNAAIRFADQYVDWEDNEKEHESQFYPNWPIFRYPKKYDVRNVKDCDFCEKNFDKHRDFSHGIFSVGCACELNITYGYELMLCRESAHNIFRLLMCRDINLHELKGIIFDHSCGLDQYLLNREPREFEYLRCLVDGAHWQVFFFYNFTHV